MAEYGLTLPEHDLTATEFKELARRIGRAAFVPLFLKFYERVITNEASIEEQRKALTDIARWTGVEEDKKSDPNANLPMFNIIFGAPGQPMQALEVVQETPAPAPPPADPIADAALAMIPPEMLQPIMKEMRDAADQERPPAGAGLQTPPKPKRQRRREQPAAAEPEALPMREPATGQAPVQALHLSVQEVVTTLEEDMASLDALLGD